MDQPVKVHTLSQDEALVLFDKAARRELHMSGDEFLHAFDLGKFDKDADRPAIMRVLMLLPLVRS
jgi:hypothetical protein